MEEEVLINGAEAAASAGAHMTLMERFDAGGIFMWPIAFIGVLVIMIVLERTNALYLKHKFNKGQILGEVRNAIYSGNLMIVGQSIIHQMIQTGFQAFERTKSEKEIQLALDASASKFFPGIEKNASYLTMLANIATLTGLLGTISGLIVSFAGAAQADPTKKAETLAAGISEAMNCTAFGLIVAIPALLSYAFIQGRAQKLIDDINEVVLESMNFVVSNKDKLGSKK